MKRQIDFLNRLFDLIKCRSELLQYLKEEKLVTDTAIKSILNEHASTHARQIYDLMSSLAKDDKLQLVDYEWTILPFERLKLTLISHSGKKEFEYNA
jgi:hypothetical protein